MWKCLGMTYIWGTTRLFMVDMDDAAAELPACSGEFSHGVVGRAGAWWKNRRAGVELGGSAI